MVRIELGARSDHWPAETHGVQSYLADMFDLAEGSSSVKALAAERTFWEKATLLHAECHRDSTVPQPSRITRHYHDMASLAQSDVAHKALHDVALRERVVLHKSIYFRSGWARYDLCLPGSFRLIPPNERLSELEHDHQAMQPMFFSKSLSLNQLMEILSVLENQINQPDRKNDITAWLLYFADVLLKAQQATLARIEFLIRKTKRYDRLRGQLNPRQEKALARMLKAGPEGFTGGLKVENYLAIT